LPLGWPASRFAEARDIVAAVRAGEPPSLSLGGGGRSLDEDGVLPIVTDRCETSCVWYVNPTVR